jgi:hypothetical protein
MNMYEEWKYSVTILGMEECGQLYAQDTIWPQEGPQYPLDRKLGGFQRLSERHGQMELIRTAELAV